MNPFRSEGTNIQALGTLLVVIQQKVESPDTNLNSSTSWSLQHSTGFTSGTPYNSVAHIVSSETISRARESSLIATWLCLQVSLVSSPLLSREATVNRLGLELQGLSRLACCVILGELLKLSLPQFPLVHNLDKGSSCCIYLEGLKGEIKMINQIKG